MSAADYIGDTETIAVTDDDTLALTLALSPISISESGGNSTGTVTRNNGDLSSSLIVAVSSSDTSEAAVPATVTIPVGQTSATFVITAVDDAIVDGTQVLSISVSASDYIGYSSGLNVTDNDSLALTLSLDSLSVTFRHGVAKRWRPVLCGRRQPFLKRHV